MKIWLINPYGPIPSEAWRTYCFPLIAEALTAEGHQVTWWTSNFSHHFKKFRSDGWADIEAWKGFHIRLVPTPGYRRNIGIGRVFRDVVFALRTYHRGRSETRPDLIIHSESPLTFGFAGQRLADHHGCPAIYHQMDLWPELIVQAFKPLYRGFIDFLLKPVYVTRRNIFRRLSAVTALATPYLDAAFEVAPELRSKPHAVIYNGIDVNQFRSQMDAQTVWPVRFPVKRDEEIWAVFAGSLGPSYDISTLCEAAKYLASISSLIHIIVAGDGPLRPMVETTSQSPEIPANLHYLGQLSPTELAALYSRCDIALCAYSPASNVEMPDKIYDYTAAGLPVLVSLKGEVADVVSRNGAGKSYVAGSHEDLSKHLLALAADPAALMAMAKASHKLGLDFDKGIQYKKFLEIIDAVVANTRSLAE